MAVETSRQLDSFDREAQVAIRAVRDVMSLARSLERRVHASTKSDTSPVTVADFAIQAILGHRLARAFPGVPMVAEEDATSLYTTPELSTQVVAIVGQIVPGATIERVADWIGEAGSLGGSRFWTVDPIDGTKGFIHGRQYVIALALVVGGRVEVCVIGCPRLSVIPGGQVANVVMLSADGGIAMAVRGHGAWWSNDGSDAFQRLTVSTCGDVSHARVVQSFEERHGDPKRLADVLRSLGILAPPLLMDSQAKHVTLAAGSSDLLIRFPPDALFRDAVWDQAAGSLLIEEAGGRVTDLAGRPLDFTNGRRLLRNSGMLASNGLIHEAVLAAVRRAT